jgi:hypothetical protein
MSTLSNRSRNAFFSAAAVIIAGATFVRHVDAQATSIVKRQSSATDRKEVSITVYNGGFGLVREVRDVDLTGGTVALEFRDVASQIQPETVTIKPQLAGAFSILEQSYRYDLLTPQKLLEKYVGKKVKVYRWNEKLGKDEAFDADVLSVQGGQSVLKINGEITYDFPGRIAFPDVPQDLIAKPTLVWTLSSAQPKQKLEVSYLTHGLSWRADYVLVVNENDTLGDLTGWVTLNNTSGATYENAKLKLVAGDVQRASDGEYYPHRAYAKATAAPMGGAGFHEEGFFEYHLYTLSAPTTVMQNEQKQVSLLSAAGAGVKKTLILNGQRYWYSSRYADRTDTQKVGVYLDLQNSEANHLGMPLPKGIVRVYKADSSGGKQLIGEDSIDHTPKDERVRVKMGESFDVVAERKQTDYKVLGTCTAESAYEIVLRDHKDTAETVEIVEPVGGDWEVLSSSIPSQKRDQQTLVFDAKVPAKGETKVVYRIRVRWC